jgi:hypothetical protein
MNIKIIKNMIDNITDFKYKKSNLLKILYEAGNNGILNQEERVKIKGKKYKNINKKEKNLEKNTLI